MQTSYFMRKIKHIKNRQNLTATKEIMSVSLLELTGHQYEPVPRETLQTAQRGLTGSSPFTNAGLSRLPELFPFPSIQFPLCFQSGNRTRRWESTYVLSHKLHSNSVS